MIFISYSSFVKAEIRRASFKDRTDIIDLCTLKVFLPSKFSLKSEQNPYSYIDFNAGFKLLLGALWKSFVCDTLTKQGVLTILQGLIDVISLTPLSPAAAFRLNLSVLDAKTPPLVPLLALTMPQNSFT